MIPPTPLTRIIVLLPRVSLGPFKFVSGLLEVLVGILQSSTGGVVIALGDVDAGSCSGFPLPDLHVLSFSLFEFLPGLLKILAGSIESALGGGDSALMADWIK